MVLDRHPLLKMSLIFSTLFLLTACSNSKQTSKTDSLENVNRKIYTFNEGVDKALLKPVAYAYKKTAPKFIDKTIGNFFGNLGDVGNVFNNTLQGKFSEAVDDAERFVINSTFGFVGLVDVASAAGIKKHNEDFGQTLAKWGVKSGPYVVIPLLGPSTLRDAAAKVSVDRLTNPSQYSHEKGALFVADTVKQRSDFFVEEEIIENLSDDNYSAHRDVWIENRKFLIRDGVNF